MVGNGGPRGIYRIHAGRPTEILNEISEIIIAKGGTVDDTNANAVSNTEFFAMNCRVKTQSRSVRLSLRLGFRFVTIDRFQMLAGAEQTPA